MDNEKRFTGPFLLALALHLILLGLFALSALYKPQVKESESEPVTEVIHATMIDTASLQAEANAIKKAKAAKAQAEKERLEARERGVINITAKLTDGTYVGEVVHRG